MLPAGRAFLRAGSFDGSHIYADNGIYTVTVTITDDDAGSTSATFTVTVNNVAPTLTVAPNQTVNEGSLLSIADIGKFTDPGFDNPLNVGGETTETFTFAINWGDGRPVDSGSATIDTPGANGVLTAGSFDGSHIYADNGTYTVTLTVNDDDSGTTSATFTVTVNNVAPTLTAAPNQTVNEGSLLSITDIGKFTDPGFDNPLNVGGETTETFTFAINWGDGRPVDSGSATIDTLGVNGVLTAGSFDGSHIYADNGTYTVTLTVNDDDSGTTSATFAVTVNNVAPTLTAAPNQTVNEGSLLSITDIGKFTDPGFDNPLNVGGETTETFTFAINWGDGRPVDSGSATIDTPGANGVLTAGSFDGSHIYADNGTYTVTLTVNDDDSGTTSATFTVLVNNVAPTLTAAPNQTVNEGSLLSITDIGKFTDPGFDNPLNVGGETTETFTFAINWGDGRPVDSGSATIDTPGANGVLTAGSFDGSHIYADNGTYTVTLTVNDDDSGTTSATFTVLVNNVAPTLTAAPNQTVNEGSLLSITDIGKFTDPGFDNPLNVGGETTETFTFAINWGDGRPVDSGSATIDTLGANGVLTAGSFDGSHIYADNGTYTVTLTINDDDSGTTIGTFTVSVNNVAPSLTVSPDRTVGPGAPLTVTDIGKFTDPGFDNPLNVGGETTERFTFAINWGDGTSADTGPGVIHVPGANGVLTAGSFDNQHIFAQGGVYTVTVTVFDDDGGSASGTFTVYVGPNLTVTGNRTVDEGSLLTITNIGQFNDPAPASLYPAGDPAGAVYSYTIYWGDGTVTNAGTAAIDTPGAPGLFTLGSFDGSHLYADNGVYTVTQTITASDGRTHSGTMLVTVNNVAPSLTSLGNQIVAQTRPIELPNIGKFTDPGFDNPLNVGGQTVERFTFTINWGDGTADTGPGVIHAPGSAGVRTSGSFDGVHSFAAGGTYTVTVTVRDDDGGSAARSFQMTVAVIATSKPLRLPSEAPPPIQIVRTTLAAADSRPIPPAQAARFDFQPSRFGSIAGTEMRFVLRIVSPAGVEDKENEETLPDDALNNLRNLFKRLPDGNYRIYQIQPDGVERLVVDVIVRQGRSIDAADEAEGVGDSIPEGAEPEPAGAPPDETLPGSALLNARQPLPTPILGPAATDRGDESAAHDERWAATAMALGSGYVAYAVPAGRRSRIGRGPSRRDERPLTKVHRLLRRLR